MIKRMKKISVIAAFLFVACNNSPQEVTSTNEQKNDTVLTIQKWLVGKWMCTDDSSIMNIGYDTIRGGFTSSALCKYKIEIEEPHGKIKPRQYWFGFDLHRCKDKDSTGFNEYFGGISIDSASMHFYAFTEEQDTALKACETEAFIKIK